MHVATLWWFAFNQFLFLFWITCCFGLQAFILDYVFGCHGNDIALVVESLAPSTTTNLVEVAGGEYACFYAAVFTKLSEEHSSNWHIDSNA